MKITAKKYAESLLASVEGKSKKEVEQATKNLLDILVENKDLKMSAQIINQFSKLWDKKNSISRVEVTSANELTKSTKKDVEKFVATKFDVKTVEIVEKIDKSLMGGIVIRVGDRIYDGSLKSRVYDLKETIVN